MFREPHTFVRKKSPESPSELCVPAKGSEALVAWSRPGRCQGSANALDLNKRELVPILSDGFGALHKRI